MANLRKSLGYSFVRLKKKSSISFFEDASGFVSRLPHFAPNLSHILAISYPELRLLVLILVSLLGCSLGTDPKVLNRHNASKVPQSCSNLKVSGPLMDAPSLMSLVDCFNSEKAIESYSRLLHELRPDELDFLISVINNNIFARPRSLFSLSTTYQQLKLTGLLDLQLRQLKDLLTKDELLRPLLEILYQWWFLKTHEEQERDLRAQKLFDTLKEGLSKESLPGRMDLVLNIMGSAVFSEVSSKIWQGAQESGQKPGQNSSNDTEGRDEWRRKLLKNLIAYLSEMNEGVDLYHSSSATNPKHPVLNRFISTLQSRVFWQAINNLYGVTEKDFQKNIPFHSKLVEVLSQDSAHILDELSTGFHYLREPIHCLRKNADIPDGIIHLIEEMVNFYPHDPEDFLLRKLPLKTKFSASLCEMPGKINDYFPPLFDIAQSGAVQPLQDFHNKALGIKDSTGYPFLELVLALIGDVGFGETENKGGIKYLLPVFSDLHKRDLFKGFMLLGFLFQDEDREELLPFLETLYRQREDIGGKSHLDLALEVIQKVSLDELSDFLGRLGDFVKKEPGFFEGKIQWLRELYYFNSSHPFLDLAKSSEFLELALKLSKKSGFYESLKLTATMIESGELKNILDILVKLYSEQSEKGRMEIQLGSVPALPQRMRHGLSLKDLTPFVPPSLQSGGEKREYCSNLDFQKDLFDPRDPEFKNQIDKFIKCLSVNGTFTEIENSYRFLQESKNSHGRTFLDLPFDWISWWNPSSHAKQFTTDRFIDSLKDLNTEHKLKGASFWIFHPVNGAGGGEQTLLPIFHLASELLNVSFQSHLRPVSAYVSRQMKNDDLPGLIHYLDEISGGDNSPGLGPDPGGLELELVSNYPKKELGDAIRKFECNTATVEARTQEIIHDFENTITSWDLVNQKPRQSWDFKELNDRINGVLEVFVRPHGSYPTEHVFQALARNFRYYTLSPHQLPNQHQHFEKSRLERWLRLRSQDSKIITYYYPEDEKPRVRLVNTLERLELVLIDADFRAPVIKTNYGLKFLDLIADSWGDEPFEIWPIEIQKRFPKGSNKRPYTLKEAVKIINKKLALFKSFLGLPKPPKCPRRIEPVNVVITDFSALKRRIYNLLQVVSVLDENVPQNTPTQDEGLKVMRNLLFEMKLSTPEKYRKAKLEDETLNHLSAVSAMSRLGFFRQISRLMRTTPAQDLAVQKFYHSMIEGGISAAFSDLAKTLLVKDSKRALFENVFRKLYDASDIHGAVMRNNMLFSMSLISRFGLIDPAAQLLAKVANDFYSLLVSRADLLVDLTTDASFKDFLRNFFENNNEVLKSKLMAVVRTFIEEQEVPLSLMNIYKLAVESSSIQRNWELFKSNRENLLNLPEYQPFRHDFDHLADEFKLFITHRSKLNHAVEAEVAIRYFMADRFASDDIFHLLEFLGKYPDKTYEMLRILPTTIERGDFRELLEMSRRALKFKRLF